MTEAIERKLEVGEVQWHSSEEDGGPDVGIMLALGSGKHLWVGEMLDADGVSGTGIVIYGADTREAFSLDYDDLRVVFEEHVAPALRARPTQETQP